MILSRGRNYIFVHIPKTGGTAMALALEGRAMKDDIMLGDTPKAKRRRHRAKDMHAAGRLWKHSTLADIEGLVSVDEMAGMFAFTLVRNPWDRMVSYYHWLRGQTFDHVAVRLAQSLKFDAFLLTPEIQDAFRANPYRSYMTVAGRGFGHFIRLEQFEEDAAPLWEHLGFVLTMPVVNASERARDYRAYYSESQAEAVAEFCSEDIKRFGYSFD